MSEWTQIGSVGVDAGLLTVGDPCYFDGISYDNDILPVVLGGYEKGQNHWNIDYSGGMIVFSTTWGDGVYPVYAKFDNRGRPTEVKVVMDWDDDDYNEEDESLWEEEEEWDDYLASREPGADDLRWD